MPGTSWRWRAAAVAALGVAVLACCGTGGGRGQQPTPEPVANPKLTPLYYGTNTCAFCHTQPPPGIKETFLCRLTEFKDWEKGDKHQDAYKALTGERALLMKERLGYDPSTKDACLNCHTVVIGEKKLRDDSLKKGFRVEEGVSCVVCHGAYLEWVRDHGLPTNLDDWRGYTRAKKEREFGMTDLWDPVKRAAKCASCHVGDAGEGKVVTHEMYAAGHPPLPGFEVATFSDAMPRHWQYRREKKPEVQQRLEFDGKEREETKLMLVGAAVSLRASMRLLADHAAACNEAKDPEQRGLDYANFDCYACHHDLKSPSWRQARGYQGKPGRPGAPAWPTALVKLAVAHAAEDDEAARQLLGKFNEGARQVNTAFSAQPFGDTAQLAPAAKALETWADDLARKLAEKPCESKEAGRILGRLPQEYQTTLVDYDSAREIAWALRVMYKELKPKPDKEVSAALDALNKELRLDLPSGKERSIMKELGEALKALNNYDPEKFKEALARVSGRLTAAR